MRKKQFLRAREKSFTSNSIKSTRRILFNHLNRSFEDRSSFHAVQHYGSGSCALIRKHGNFFLLTAKHVIQSATGFDFQNESPFWVTVKSNFFGSTIFDFLMPSKIFHIGDLIANRGNSIDTGDLVLVELFRPVEFNQPDHFLDFDSNDSPLLAKDKFFDGQLLFAAGFPFELNSFSFFDEPIGGRTHETTVQRHVFNGFCLFENGEPYMANEGLSDLGYENLSGMSGGVVTNIQPKSNQVKVLGMLLSGGKSILRFLPSYFIQEAIDNFNRAKVTIVDPTIIFQERHDWTPADIERFIHKLSVQKPTGS
jgi:hypothetical protein